MARISATVYSSHVPAIGVAMDQHLENEPYWQPVFDGYAPSRRWLQSHTPDVVVLVYNDHANAFSLDVVPTFAIGLSDQFAIADEGWGPRPVPPVLGHPALAAHLAHSLIEQDFDLTTVRCFPVDHGLTVPLSLLFGDVHEWPCAVIPVAVNVVQYPIPSGRRCLALGRAIRQAVMDYEGDLNVQVWGTGGMSHQLQGPRAGLINPEFDNTFVDELVRMPVELSHKPHLEYVREAGSEGIELVMWLVARGAMGDLAGGPAPSVQHRFYHVPASNTAVGHLVLEEADTAESTVAP